MNRFQLPLCFLPWDSNRLAAIFHEINTKILKLANAKGKSSVNCNKSYSSLALKLKALNGSKKIYDSIENYKRINALTVFLNDDNTATSEDDSKFNKEKIKNEEPTAILKHSDKITKWKRNEKFEEVVKAYSGASTHSFSQQKSKSKNSSKDRDDRHSKSILEKMALSAASPAVKRICSKDHKAREKATAEKYGQKLKGTVKRIPATQKYLYTFELTSDAINEKEKDHYSYDIKRTLSAENNKSRKRNSDFLKRQEFNSPPKSTHLLELEKQIKGIRAQKKQINQLITKELRDTKISWQEATNNNSSANFGSNFNRSRDPRVQKLCESLEKSTLDVANLYRSYTGLDSLKHDVERKVVERYDNALLKYERGDDNYTPSLGNRAETTGTCRGYNTAKESNNNFSGHLNGILKKPTLRMSNENVAVVAKNDPIRNTRSNVEAAVDKFSNLNISTHFLKNDSSNNNLTINDTNFSKESRQCIRNDNWTNGFTRKNCDNSSQIGTSDSVDLSRKFSAFNYAFPQLYKSEYLRKACGLK